MKKSEIAFFKSLIQDTFFGDCSTVINQFHSQRKSINLDNITNLLVENITPEKNFSIERLLFLAERRSGQTPKNFEEGEG